MIDDKALPVKFLLYRDGVKLPYDDLLILEQLRALNGQGVDLILCSTYLDYFNLTNHVRNGIVGCVTDISEVIQKAEEVTNI